MPMIYQKMIYREDLQNNPHVLYAFGDNEAREGYGGQARYMRGEANAVGIATKKSPRDYWSAHDCIRQMDIILKDMAPLFDAVKEGKTVVWPLDGIGTGLAALEFHSPVTFKFLVDQMNYLRRLANGE
jgi:hypothetical protein